LAAEAETVVVVGGHLHAGDPLHAAFEEAFETPQGLIEADSALLEAVRSRLRLVEDRVADNTVEVQLPMVRHFLPQAKLLAFRAPPDGKAVQLGRELAVCARELGRDLVVLGSTDLTHYGPNYGFAPRGGGEEAVRWVREVNDRRFIDAALACDPLLAISLARSEQSACSAGGAGAAMAFAGERGACPGELVSYRTSYDVMPGSSFVGYGGVLYSLPAERG
jgi:AmmeMemoRadiSam system protein B